MHRNPRLMRGRCRRDCVGVGIVVGGVAGVEEKGVNPEEMRVDTPAGGPDGPSNDVCSPISLIRLI